VLNLDNPETATLSAGLKPGQAVIYGLRATQAHVQASPPIRSPTGIAVQVKDRDSGEVVEVALKVQGPHNVANALAALSVAKACRVGLAEGAAAHLGEFSGIRRRLEVVGTASEITVIDDFTGHARNHACVSWTPASDVSAPWLRPASFDEGRLGGLLCKRIAR